MVDDRPNSLTLFHATAEELLAVLVRLAQTPPDLKAYLEAHAAALCKYLPLVGLAYHLAQGSSLQCIYAQGVQAPEVIPGNDQELAFKKAISAVASQAKPLVLPPHTEPAETLRSVSGGDVPSSHQLPLFNQTEFFQVFLPIVLADRVIGVFHTWIQALPRDTVGPLLDTLGRACGVMELYFKSRQVEDTTAEIIRLHSYGKFLEDLAGDIELSTVAKVVLDYASVCSGASRVTLLLAVDYATSLTRFEASQLRFNYVYYQSKGVQCPESTSQEARALEGLTKFLLEKIASNALDSVTTSGSTDKPQLPKAVSSVLLQAPAGKRPQATLHWVKREQSLEHPEAVQNYLALAPMHWATGIPLVDTQQRIVGFLLFEGREDNLAKSAEALLKLQGLIYSGGHAVATALFWYNRRTLRWAKKWINWRDGTLDTPKKRKWAYILVPLGIIASVLAYPMQFNIKAPAQIRPSLVAHVAAETSSRILSVDVHEGDSVKANQLLMSLDTDELGFQRRRLESDYLQALADADLAMGTGDEAAMQAARFKAARAQAQIQFVVYQMQHCTIRAPFDGVLLGPKNIRQKVGHIAKVGDLLAEVAELGQWEVKIQLYEQDVVYLSSLLGDQPNLLATLKLTADPGVPYSLVLKDSAELSHGLEVHQDEYYFIAVLPLDIGNNPNPFLKAGFSGKVAFHIGRRPVAYVLFRDLVRYLRVQWF